MPELPLVSVIVPVFNGERYLRESLDSIRAQTYPRIEILVMDDASTDATPQILAGYGDCLRVHRQARNRGIYGNANDGIALARGELIAVYHADDVYDPRIVEREVAFLQRYPEAGAVFCKTSFVDLDGREFGRMELPPDVRGGKPLEYAVIFNALLRHKNHFLMCPTAMVRAAAHQQVGVYRDAQFRNTSDLDMWLRIARVYPIGILEEYLLRYRRGHASSSERYHHLRTEPERFFVIMDLYLTEGDHTLAAPDARAAYEAHRAEDTLMRVVNHYILDQLSEARARIREVKPTRLLASARVQRVRLLALYLLMQILVRLHRISFFADLFYARWHAKRKPRTAPQTFR